MKIRALGILEPPGYDQRVMPGQRVEVPDEYGASVCRQGLAEAIAEKPRDRAEKRPAPAAERR